MSAILSLSRSEIFSSRALMGAGSIFSGISPISRSAEDALSRYCSGDLIATCAMSLSSSERLAPRGRCCRISTALTLYRLLQKPQK